MAVSPDSAAILTCNDIKKSSSDIQSTGGMVTLGAGALSYQYAKASAPRLLHSKTGEQVD
ncbi:hypothetical protein [Corallococcus sp. AB030]|uniref:hypothetical protein n=1 Tax=Corallococcus sp. AB030 TaxID=2316716 RepID=UPI0011E5CE1A|nr:hypothetical protein [Corallococcus sp. AB030]